jgi:hypothetical protein
VLGIWLLLVETCWSYTEVFKKFLPYIILLIILDYQRFFYLTWCVYNRHQKSPSPFGSFFYASNSTSYELRKNKTLTDSKMDLGILGVCYMHIMLKSAFFDFFSHFTGHVQDDPIPTA